MSGRGEQGRGGGRDGKNGGRGGRGHSRGGRGATRKSTRHTNPIQGLEKHIFDTGKPEYAALFTETWEKLCNRRRQLGEKEGNTMARAMEEFTDAVIPEPAVPAATIPDPNNPNNNIANPRLATETLLWESKVKMIPGREANLARQKEAAFVDVWDACSPLLKTKLKALTNWDQINTDKNVIQMGLQIKAISCGLEQTQEPMFGLAELIKKMMLFYQKPEVSNDDYKKQFEALWDSITEQGGSLTNHPGPVGKRARALATENGRARPNDDDTTQAKEEVAEQMKAMFFLSGANDKVHGALKTYLVNEYTAGRNAYPPDIPSALSMMDAWRVPQQQHTQQRGHNNNNDDELCQIPSLFFSHYINSFD